MSPILFFIIFFTCPGMGKIFLQINSAAVAFINILIAAWEGLIIIYHSTFGQRDWGLSGWVGEGVNWVGKGKDGLKCNFDHLNFTWNDVYVSGSKIYSTNLEESINMECLLSQS